MYTATFTFAKRAFDEAFHRPVTAIARVVGSHGDGGMPHPMTGVIHSSPGGHAAHP